MVVEALTEDERATLVSAADRPFMSAYAQATKALRIIDQLTALTTPPDFGVEHKLLTDWVNALPEPFRGFVVALETNADPSGNIRDAVCQRENAEALANRVLELDRRWELAEAENGLHRIRIAELEARNSFLRERYEENEASRGATAQALSDALAKVAELEAWYTRAMKREQAALARAEAAERDRDDWRKTAQAGCETCPRAESEAAALRAERDAANALMDALGNELENQRLMAFGDAVGVVEAFARILSGQAPARTEPVPVPMVLHCPECRTRHLDEGEFATKVHHTHSCQGCGLTWRPAVAPTVGVQFLPGFKNEAPARSDHERAVLSAFAAYVTHWQKNVGDDEIGINLRCDAIAAELARREAAK